MGFIQDQENKARNHRLNKRLLVVKKLFEKEVNILVNQKLQKVAINKEISRQDSIANLRHDIDSYAKSRE